MDNVSSARRLLLRRVLVVRFGPIGKLHDGFVHGWFHVVQQRLWVDAKEYGQRQQRRGNEELANGHRRERFGMWAFVFRAEVNPLYGPKDVASRKDDDGRRDDGQCLT